MSTSLATTAGSLLAALCLSVPSSGGALAGFEDEVLPEEDRRELEWAFLRGDRRVLEDLDELVLELPADSLTRALRARVRFASGKFEAALADAAQATREVLDSEAAPAVLATCARTEAEILYELGRTRAALDVLESAGGALVPEVDARDAWILGRVRRETGDVRGGLETLRAGALARGPRTWDVLLAQARCQRELGRIEAAASTLVAADEAAAEAGFRNPPDVLVELGLVYFEAYGEVDDPLSRAHSPAELFREVLGAQPDHEGALLGLFELTRFNWRRARHSPSELLEDLFAAHPRSIRGLLAQASKALDDGDLKTARAALGELESIAPGRRDVRTEKATLAWIENDREEAEAILAELVELVPDDSGPEREVGRHLLELYRFAEGLGFLDRAVERNPKDWRAWKELGRAQANTGYEKKARESLAKATEKAEGRRDAWRDNTLLVLERMAESHVEHTDDALTFSWTPASEPVLSRYWGEFYNEAREELARRYGYTPDEVRIEVFERWNDFSVRSTGFEGYPALGVCFGPVVTAVSPLSELRGQFSWARTSFHEFTHVVHLGLSHNRCPRWITEGLATWEEGTRNPAWWRNMRRELIDARANGTIIPVRRLNAAFRGPRVLFAYFQGGLLCKMLIEEHGFSPMVRLLSAFDRGLDLDGALAEIFQRTPEELDAELAAFIDREISALAIEPRWSRESTFRRRFRLARRPPEDPDGRLEWSDEWCKVAWGYYWAEQLVDAEEALRQASSAGELPPRGLFLQGEIALQQGRMDDAAESFRRGFAAGGEDYRARMALAGYLIGEQELDEAEVHLLAAERAFPGYDSASFSAELRLADLYEFRGDEDAAHEARLRWLGYNADDYEVRVDVAEWLDSKGRVEESERAWNLANDVDPFRRHLHLSWGKALLALERHEEALREFEVGLLVTEALDGDVLRARGVNRGDQLTRGGDELPQGPVVPPLLADASQGDSTVLERFLAQEALLHGYRALALLELGRGSEAQDAVDAALALDSECAPALEARSRMP